MSAVQPPAPHDACAGLEGAPFPPSTAVAPTTPSAPGFPDGEEAAVGAGAGAAAAAVPPWAAVSGAGAFSPPACVGAAAPDPGAGLGAMAEAACGAGSAATDEGLLHALDALAPRTASAAMKVSRVSEGLRIAVA